MSTTIGQSVSRLRNTIKSVKSDAFITDRYLYSMVVKYAQALIKRTDTLNRILKLGSVFSTIPCLTLIETNRVEACCGAVVSNCVFKRTEDKIPNLLEGEFGPVIRTVSSIDGSIEVYATTPSTYTSMTKTKGFKFNKNLYYWYLNGYLYFPNVTWDAVMVQALFEGDLNGLTCPSDACIQRQDQNTAIPDFLIAEVEQYVLKELGVMFQLPEDVNSSDKQSQSR